LIYFSNGSITYYITTDNHILFSYVYLNKYKKLRNYFKNAFWSPLFLLKKLIFICYIELFPGKNAQYCLSAGTQGKIFSIDAKNYTALIQLPSKIKKIISYYSYVFFRKNSIRRKKKNFIIQNQVIEGALGVNQ